MGGHLTTVYPLDISAKPLEERMKAFSERKSASTLKLRGRKHGEPIPVERSSVKGQRTAKILLLDNGLLLGGLDNVLYMMK
jgi:hypothetical protein